MPVVLLLAVVAILGGTLVVARGRGGELALARPDVLPRRLPLATADDMAAYRPPSSFFGYSVTATDEALLQIAEAVAERDEQLVLLRREIAQLRGDAASAGHRDQGGATQRMSRWAAPGSTSAADYRAAEDPVWGPPGGYQAGRRYSDAGYPAGDDPAEGYPGRDHPGRDDPAEGDAGDEPG